MTEEKRTKVIRREEMIVALAPAEALMSALVSRAREATTLARMAVANPEVTQDAGLMRLGGQKRWIMLANGLVAGIPAVEGFAVLSTEAQHNGGQYVFGFPGGVLTVKREPHDKDDPQDGKYFQEALEGVLESAALAEGIDADAAVKVYLAVTPKKAVLKITHTTLAEPMVIALSDLVQAAIPVPVPKTPRPRARARSTRKPAPAEQRNGQDHATEKEGS